MQLSWNDLAPWTYPGIGGPAQFHETPDICRQSTLQGIGFRFRDQGRSTSFQDLASQRIKVLVRKSIERRLSREDLQRHHP